MQPVSEGWNIIVVGFWNTRIFNPKWIKSNLAESENIGIQFPVNNPNAPPRFDFDDILFYVEKNSIKIEAKTPDTKNLNSLQQKMSTILEKLPHTPIIATGFNFRFIENNPRKELINLFELNDLVRLAEKNINILNTVIQRKFLIEEQIVNLKFSLDSNSKVVIEFNFHRDTNNADSALKFINEKGITYFMEKSKEIMKEVYITELEDEEE